MDMKVHDIFNDTDAHEKEELIQLKIAKPKAIQ